jgi:ABC-type amino acid transport substrate-binding protein
MNCNISPHYVLPFKRLKTRIPNDLPSVTLGVQRLTQENLLAHQKKLEVQNFSYRTRQALLDATTALNLIQGQAMSDEGIYDIPKVIY